MFPKIVCYKATFVKSGCSKTTCAYFSPILNTRVPTYRGPSWTFGAGSRQAVVRQWSDNCQAVVRQSSGSGQAAVRQCSGQAAVRQSSGIHVSFNSKVFLLQY